MGRGTFLTLRTWLFQQTSLETHTPQSSTPRPEFCYHQHSSNSSHGTTMRWVTQTESSTLSSTCSPRTTLKWQLFLLNSPSTFPGGKTPKLGKATKTTAFVTLLLLIL